MPRKTIVTTTVRGRRRRPTKRTTVVKRTQSTRARRPRRRGAGRVSRLSPGGQHFVKCYLTPQLHRMASRYPDGVDVPTVAFENRTLSTITFDGTNNNLVMVLPTLGNNLYWKKCNSASDSKLDAGNSGWKSVNAQKTVASEWTSVAQSFRTVSLSVTLTPLSAVSNRQGLITAGRLRTELWPITDGAFVTSTGTYQTYFVGAVGNIDDAKILLGSDSINGPPTQNFTYRAALKNRAHLWKQAQQGYVTCGSLSTSFTASSLTQPIDATNSGSLDGATIVAGLDDNTTPLILNLSGLGSANKFLVEVVHCIELIPVLFSDWSLLAVHPPPKDELAIEAAFEAEKKTTPGGFFDNPQQLGKMLYEQLTRLMPGGFSAGAPVSFESFSRPAGQLALNY